MSTLSASTGRTRVNNYRRGIERILRDIDVNMESMRLDNANRREEMDELAEDIKQQCGRALRGLDSLTFK
jgi:hypothetical protein